MDSAERSLRRWVDRQQVDEIGGPSRCPVVSVAVHKCGRNPRRTATRGRHPGECLGRPRAGESPFSGPVDNASTGFLGQGMWITICRIMIVGNDIPEICLVRLIERAYDKRHQFEYLT